MKIVILAGGLPSAISEEDEKIPKPMAEIGGRPILWHIMKSYAYFGFHDFIICTGYKGKMIKDYFRDYYIYQSDITVDLQNNKIDILRKQTEDWKVTIVDTGNDTSIIERIERVKQYVGQETFIVAYGDCVFDIDIGKFIAFHRQHERWATVAIAKPTGRNEALAIAENGELLASDILFQKNGAWVNACNMIFEPKIFEFMENSKENLEKGLYIQLAKRHQIMAYRHEGFWSPMETKRDQTMLENLWRKGCAPWKVWE